MDSPSHVLPGPGALHIHNGALPKPDERTRSRSPKREPERRTRAARAVRVTERFDAAPSRVFDAWLDPANAGAWLFATASRPIREVAIDPRVGGEFRLVERRDGEFAEHTGNYLEIAPHRRLAFTLRTPMIPGVATHVTVEFAQERDACSMQLTHENVPRGRIRATAARWSGILYGLGVMLHSNGERRSR